ncbi:MAG: hypothetical protein FWE19_02185 [Oscillospiraceae bacterium]|nr:hypothetical protein [Oscillospiraceae bacterium]
MDNNIVSLHDSPVEQQCAKCKGYEEDVEAYEILLLGIAFIGPIIGILIGLFAGKKLLSK